MTRMHDIPPLDNGWQTANNLEVNLRHKYPGNDVTWNKRLKHFATELEKQFMIRDGMSEPQAKKRVGDEYVGWRRTHNGKRALAISPKALDMLIAELPLLLGKDWDTPNSYHNRSGISDAVARELFEENKIAAIEDTAYTLSKRKKPTREQWNEARDLILDNYTGPRKPARGPVTIAAGPDAQRSIEKRIIPKIGPDEVNPGQMAERYGRSEKFWREKMIAAIPEYRTRMEESLGVSENDARKMVDKTLIGLRTPKTGGNPGFAASLMAARDLAEKYAKDKDR